MPTLELRGRVSGQLIGEFNGVASVGDPTLYSFDVGTLEDGDYSGTIESPTGAIAYRVTNGVGEVQGSWDDFQVIATPTPSTDPADKPKSIQADNQRVEQHSLPDRIAWERHQAEKSSGGWGAIKRGQVRLGGPMQNGG